MPPSKRPIRVLVVEDSNTARQLLVELLKADGGFDVVGEAVNGADAVEAAGRLAPDLITMDVQMPVLDGLEATREIMQRTPTPIVIVSSSMSSRDVKAALTATQAGALMVVPKPSNPLASDFARTRDEFLSMAKAMAGVHVVRRWGGGSHGAAPRSTSFVRRPMSRGGAPVAPRLLAIATSTGGPAALHRLLSDLPADFSLPIVVVQHMAHGFIQGLADWLESSTNRRVVVAVAGTLVEAGTAYLAPDDQHMSVTPSGHIALADSPPLNGFRPAADHLFDGCARAYESAMIAVILTGMGQDGTAGLRTARQAGCIVIAQDEASSVVFGMAQSAIGDGVVTEVLPLDGIAPRLASLVPRPQKETR
jgi:two-component system chemotaxis response regulator CheB